MWKIAVRGALIYLVALNLAIISLITIVNTNTDREIFVLLGILGTLLVMISLGYLPIKHWYRSINQLKTWFNLHMVFGALGAFFILLHSEFHFRSLLPAITLIVMELVAFTGFVGRFLFTYSLQELHKEDVGNKLPAYQEESGDYYLLALSSEYLRTWRWIHVKLTWLLLILALIHVITEFVWRGLRL